MGDQTQTTTATDAAAYRRGGDEVARSLGSDAASGLSAAEASARLSSHGPNRLTARRPPSMALVVLTILRAPMNIMLIVVAAAAILIGQYGITLVLAVLVTVNLVLGIRQELSSRAGVDTLAAEQVERVRVVRDGRPASIDAEELVPGDIVTVEAGDLIAADGRILESASLEVQEAALTGESAAVAKDPLAIADGTGAGGAGGDAGAEVALGDRSNMLFQGTTVSRGTARFVVTQTGMSTEIGHIATLLTEVERVDSPLQIELAALTTRVAIVAWVAVALMLVIGALRGLPVADLVLLGVTVAISSIPTSMPTFVQTMLAYGAKKLADGKAIIRNLADVETLGATSAIATDKTGTLTLNEMVVTELFASGEWFSVEGDGYGKSGRVLGAAGREVPDFTQLAYALCLVSDATVSDAGEVVGDPTEAAMVVLAAKLGVDEVLTRREYPRLAEVPFDSEYKFMATYHRVPLDGADTVVGLVKGAPDVVIDRCSTALTSDGSRVDLAERRADIEEANRQLASRGLRVLAFAMRVFPDEALDGILADPMGQVGELTFVGLLGLIDPLRPSAKAAIAEARSAGVSVRMITGDHIVTAAAIGAELGLEPGAMTGARFRAQSDEEMRRTLPDVHVFGRVSPEDKLRLVEALKAEGEVVAMTGDAVNDAAGIKAASIGVAMGSGSAVTKQAARLVLTDDNFGTLVAGIRIGREVYDKIVAYVRYQMSTLLALVLLFLISSILGIAEGVPMTPAMVLFLAFFFSVVPVVTIMTDRPAPDLMSRPPRDLTASIASPGSLLQWLVYALAILLPTLVPLLFGPDRPQLGVASASVTMVFVVQALAYGFGGITLRRDPESGLNSPLLGPVLLMLVPVALLMMSTEFPVFTETLQTVPLSPAQWLLCFVLALVFPVVVELDKAVRRARARRAARR
ncbi:cation-translocating P-type ATPase [Compostimonas suwonensis]|uniref:Ca2+-transporting ATPase n=1 Tax=Compostimonas suwonensis TaxID=1048394 RepID=A0A2M9BVA3_9MICO|nr:cation-transporting P-type ATPase [Compostimonas suwonensis]PJJ61880.1 Ca2+-transporting ATPase [Compostimonas suwonensis]